jgi:hypothetical protein
MCSVFRLDSVLKICSVLGISSVKGQNDKFNLKLKQTVYVIEKNILLIKNKFKNTFHLKPSSFRHLFLTSLVR